MSEPIRFVYASDSHGDMADPEALAALNAALAREFAHWEKIFPSVPSP